MIWCSINFVQLNGSGGKCTIEVAQLRFGGTGVGTWIRCRRAVLGFGKTELASLTDVVHVNQIRCGTCLFEGFCYHDGDGLVIMVDTWASERAIHVELT